MITGTCLIAPTQLRQQIFDQPGFTKLLDIISNLSITFLETTFGIGVATAAQTFSIIAENM